MDRCHRQTKRTYTRPEIRDRIERYLESEERSGVPGERTIRFRINKLGQFTALNHGGRPGSLL